MTYLDLAEMLARDMYLGMIERNEEVYYSLSKIVYHHLGYRRFDVTEQESRKAFVEVIRFLERNGFEDVSKDGVFDRYAHEGEPCFVVEVEENSGKIYQTVRIAAMN